MTRDPRINRLAAMAEMVLDVRSAALRAAVERRQVLLAQLEDLKAGSDADPADIAAARAAYAFETWAASRRAEINLRLAAAQADWMAHLDETRLAFGRVRVMERLRVARDAQGTGSAVLTGDLGDEDIGDDRAEDALGLFRQGTTQQDKV
jgi:hypothetical protein